MKNLSPIPNAAGSEIRFDRPAFRSASDDELTRRWNERDGEARDEAIRGLLGRHEPAVFLICNLLVERAADAAFAAEDNLRKKRFAPNAMERIVQHAWKGNVRELRNTVERVLIMAPGDTIDVSDLPESIRYAQDGPTAQTDAATLKEFKETSERAFLVKKLRENGWNISQTAQVIGTPRSNLYKKLEQYKISQESDG